MSFLAALAGLTPGVVSAQEQPPSAALQQQAATSVASPCIQPPPMPGIEDYDGRLKKVVGTFAKHLERRSVHAPHYLPGLKLCTLSVKDKFALFVEDSLDPATFLGAAFNAGLDQAQDNDHSYGQGAQCYGRRFGAQLADQASSRFFKDFAYPSLFREDPRYYRMIHGRARSRLLHAVEHAFVARRDNGNLIFNFSEWLGTASAVVLSNTYHPDNHRGFSPAAQSVGYGVLQDVGFDVLREFWPEISRKFKLPIRGEPEPPPANAHPAP
jgi:hypothetical protein